MHVGFCSFFQNLTGLSDQAVYAHELAMSDLAEPLGFDSVWAAEHHFSDYTMCPNVAQYLTYMAGRTRRVKLGSMVMVLPWHDPVRVAEEISVLDHMSGGRVILGIGRGLGRIEFEGLRVPMGDSRQLFTEYAEAILGALETGTIQANGELYRQPPTPIRPKPFLTFKGRTYASAVSPESAKIMARLGVGIMIIAQKPWDKTIVELDNYRQLWREIHGTQPPKPLIASYIACHEDEATARQMMTTYIYNYSASAVKHYEFANTSLSDVKGYEYYGGLAKNIEKHGLPQFVEFLSRLQIAGTPEQVYRQVMEHRRLADAEGVIGIFSYGGMPHEMARANMRLFAEQVMPRLQGSVRQAEAEAA